MSLSQTQEENNLVMFSKIPKSPALPPGLPVDTNMNWKLYPKFIQNGNEVMAQLFDEVKAYLKKGTGSRYSCIVTDGPELYEGYTHVNWNDTPVLRQIRMAILEQFGHMVDYTLVHLYLSGEASIGFHSDSEAMNTPIYSLSLGATRKFRFRKIVETSGWDYEYSLKTGDMVVMDTQCQRKWKHSVPVERKIKELRMNCTFRFYE